MPVRDRPLAGRRLQTALVLAAMLVVVAPGLVAATSGTIAPEPRLQRPGEEAGYRLPFQAGLEVSIHQGWHGRYSHTGLSAYAYDFGLDQNTPVLAAASGVVADVHSGETACGGRGLLDHANYVTINHPDGSATLYIHLARVEVTIGQPVEVGEEIGRSGATGFTDCEPHLHFARQLQGGSVTQSIPVYFEEYPGRALYQGETVTSTPACGPKGDAPTGAFCGTYRGADAGAPRLFSRVDQELDFDWSRRAPGGYWLDDARSGFAASWTGRIEITRDGVYALAVGASGDVRVTIDGETLVDGRSDPNTPRQIVVSWRAAPGIHTMTVEHLQTSRGGRLRVSWTPQLIDGAWVRWGKDRPEA